MADLPDGLQYDDGFAYFWLDNRGEISNNRPTSRYTFFARARVIGQNIPQGSAFKFVVKRGRRALGEFTCAGTATYRVRFHPSNQPDELSVSHCVDRELFLDAHGELTVEVYYIDDDTEEEHLARTHKVDVRRLTQVRPGGQRRPDAFIVNQHVHQTTALIDQVNRFEQFMFSAVAGRSGSSANENTVRMYVHRSSGQSVPSLTLRCSVNGERIRLANDRVAGEQIGNSNQASEIRRVGRTNRTEGDHVHFRWDGITLPITFGGQENTQNVSLDDHPGRWECKLRDNSRTTYREFAFTVADGQIQPHPEEANDLHFPRGVHLLEVTVPADAPNDARTDPASTRNGAFYGRRWQSAEGRAMGRRVPQIGEGFPPSGRRRR